MSDEQVEPGERVITSGGDRIYPKGYSVGTVIAASPDKDNDPFQVIKIKPAADIGRLEEVLVITKMADDSQTAASGPTPMRAADILSQSLPSVPKVDPNAPKTPGSTQTGVPAPKPSPTPAKINKPVSEGTEQKPGTGTGQAKPHGDRNTGCGFHAEQDRRRSEKAIEPGTAAMATPASANGAAATTPPKPKPTPKKAVTPAVAPDSTTQQPSAAPTATPRATSTPAANQSPNQEKPPR